MNEIQTVIKYLLSHCSGLSENTAVCRFMTLPLFIYFMEPGPYIF